MMPVDTLRVPEALRKAADDALVVQNASNLSGVLHAWARHQEILKEVCGGNGRDYHEHPINVLFLSKVTSLMGINADCIGSVERNGRDLYRDAYEWCKVNKLHKEEQLHGEE